MRTFLVFCCFLFSLVQHSCKSQKQSIIEEESQEDTRIVLVDSDDYSGVYELETIVIKDVKSLNKFYGQINKTRKPGLPVPIIDFSKNTALIICAGAQESNKRTILSFGDEDVKQLIINVKKENMDTEKESTTTTTVYPFYLYTIPLTEKSIDFQYIE